MKTIKNVYKIMKDHKIIIRSQQRFKCEAHNVITEKFHKIALTFNGDKRLQSFNGVKSFPYGTSVGKVCRE